jgi:hypothetical protein
VSFAQQAATFPQRSHTDILQGFCLMPPKILVNCQNPAASLTGIQPHRQRKFRSCEHCDANRKHARWLDRCARRIAFSTAAGVASTTQEPSLFNLRTVLAASKRAAGRHCPRRSPELVFEAVRSGGFHWDRVPESRVTHIAFKEKPEAFRARNRSEDQPPI